MFCKSNVILGNQLLVPGTYFSSNNIIATLRVSVSGQMWAGTTDDSEELEGGVGGWLEELEGGKWAGANHTAMVLQADRQ